VVPTGAGPIRRRRAALAGRACVPDRRRLPSGAPTCGARRSRSLGAGLPVRHRREVAQPRLTPRVRGGTESEINGRRWQSRWQMILYHPRLLNQINRIGPMRGRSTWTALASVRGGREPLLRSADAVDWRIAGIGRPGRSRLRMILAVRGQFKAFKPIRSQGPTQCRKPALMRLPRRSAGAERHPL
jgi:hypothetical protein